MKPRFPLHRSRYGLLLGALVLLGLYSLLAASCGPTFKDEDRSIVDKPTVISVTLDPAEPSPGDTVTARFLMMDQYGRMEPEFQLWFRQGGSDSVQYGATGDTFAMLDPSADPQDFLDLLGLNDLTEARLGLFSSFTFQLADEEAYNFNESGLTSESLFIAIPLLPVELDLTQLAGDFLDDPDEAMQTLGPALAGLGESLEGRQALKVLRTLPVSIRETKNKNPRITAISVKPRRDSTDKTPLIFASPENPDNTEARQNPFVYTLGETYEGVAKDEGRVYFEVEIEDEAENQDEELRFQWFTTPGGGSFLNRQERIQRFGVPLVGIDGPLSDNPRLDPALIPIVVVVRDVQAGDGNNLGQTWAEFYLRVQR